MGIMSRLSLVLDVRGGNCDTTLPLLGSLVDCSVFQEVRKAFLCLTFGDGSSKSGLLQLARVSSGDVKVAKDYLSMINVSDSTCSAVSNSPDLDYARLERV